MMSLIVRSEGAYPDLNDARWAVLGLGLGDHLTSQLVGRTVTGFLSYLAETAQW